jgi:hypothetical protein
VLVWGEGCGADVLPPGARVVRLDAWLHPENARADVFLPISVQTERSGHYTNFAGVGEPLRGVLREARRRRRRRGAVRDAGRARDGGGDMTQDLVVALVFIVYAMGALITFGTLLTWVERKQAAVMSDRIGANRAYVRIPVHADSSSSGGASSTASPTASRCC